MDEPLSFLLASNQTAHAWPGPAFSITTRIAQQAEHQPDAIALTFEGQHLTYAELNQHAEALAGLLIEGGVQPGDLVGLMLERSFELVIALLAVLKAGAAYVPLDLCLPQARLRAMLDDCQPALVLHQGQADLAGILAGRKHLAVHQRQLATQPSSQRALPDATQPSDLIYAIYTSGSTGMPKAALNEHGGVLNRLLWLQATHPLQSGDAVLQKTPSSFDVSVWEFFWPLMVGARLVLARPGGHMDPLYLAELMVQERITVAHFVPTMLRLFLDALGSELPPSVRLLFFSGEALPADLAQRVVAQWPGAEAYNYYGPTECAVDVSYWDCRQLPQTGRVLIGHPLANTRLYILDEQLQPVAPGTPGELFIAGVQVGRGYLNRPELSAEKFLPDAFASQFNAPPGARMYRTGDVACWHVGQGIEYLGRTDFQVKVNGVRIELGEIEHAALATGLVDRVLVATQPMGAQAQRLIGLARPMTADIGWAQKLSEAIARTLPSAMQPSTWLAVEDLPLTSSGKTDRRRALREVEARVGGRIWPSLGEQLAYQISCGPHRLAVEVQGGKQWTYADLDAKSQVVAHALRDRQVVAGDRVALMLDRSADFIIAMIAIVRLGAIYAPQDPQAPAERRRQMLETLQPKVVVTSLEELTAPATTETVSMATPPAEQTACVLFTSGSTGRPKGVLLPHEGLTRLALDAPVAQQATGTRWAWLSSPGFDAMHFEVWGALLNGGTVVLPASAHPTLDELASFLRSMSIDGALLTTSLFNVMIDHDVKALGGLRHLVIGGERASVIHAQRMVTSNPGTQLINAYGPTECSTIALAHVVAAEDLLTQEGIPIGLPIQATATKIAPTRPDELADTGELILGGPGVALGYLGATTSQQSAFIGDGHQRWYRTGDLVRVRADGRFVYLGRIDQQVKLQGHRIEIDEVEQALTALPDIRQAAVVVVGEQAETRRLAAMVTCQAGAKIEPEQWRQHLQTCLPPVAVPGQIRVVDELPLTLHGKTDRQAIAQALGQAEPEESTQANSTWASPLQAELAALWKEVLGVVPQSPAAHFQACGGTSLAAMKLAALIRRRLHRAMPPGELILNPTLEAQCRMLTLLPLVPDMPAHRQEMRLSEQQQGLALAALLAPHDSSWLVHVPLLLQHPLNTATLHQALNDLAQRHPMLRLVVSLTDQGLSTRLLPALPPDVITHAGLLTESVDDMRFPDEVLDHIERPLDADDHGPMRVDLWDVPEQGQLLVWTFQHHVIDEAGIDIAWADLNCLLRHDTLPALPGSPDAFAVTEQAHLDSTRIDQTATQLALSLADATPPWSRSRSGAHRIVSMPPDLQAKLMNACERWGCTPFAPLLTAFGAALLRCAGPSWRHVLAPFSRRLDAERLAHVAYGLDVCHIEAAPRLGEAPAAHLHRVLQAILATTASGHSPLGRVHEMVAQQAPSAVPHLDQFAMTWRTHTRDTRPLGDTTARQLAYPHRRTRFGLTLHVELNAGDLCLSVEAESGAFDTGFVDRLTQALQEEIATLCKVDLARPVMDHSAPAQAETGTAIDELRATWTQFAPGTRWDLKDDPHFLRSGGTSLQAIRLSVAIQQKMGRPLDIADFLRLPTFSHLQQLLALPGRSAGPAAPVIPHLQWVGNPNAGKVLFLIPGMGGHSVSLVPLGQAMQTRLGDQYAIAIPDLETMVAELPAAPDLLARLTQSLVAQVQAIGPERLCAAAGFSLGGQLAMLAQQELRPTVFKPIFLLDTYDMGALVETPKRKTAQRIMRLWYRLTSAQQAHGPTDIRNDVELPPEADTSTQWATVIHTLELTPLRAPQTPVCLLQATRSMHYTALMCRRRENGFTARHFGGFIRTPLAIHHMEMPGPAAPLVADAVAKILCDESAPGAPPTHGISQK